MELRNIGLSQQVWEQLHSIGRQKETSPLETLEMTLRNTIINRNQRDIIYARKLFFSLGNDGEIFKSDNGNSWTKIITGFSVPLRGVVTYP